MQKSNPDRDPVDPYEFAQQIAPLIKLMQGRGIHTLFDIAEELTALGLKTRHGRDWGPAQVCHLLQTIEGEKPLRRKKAAPPDLS